MKKSLAFILTAIVGIVGLFFAQSVAHAANLTPENSLSIINTNLFGQSRASYQYVEPLNVLSDRCSTTPEHIADMSALLTKNMLDKGKDFDNLSFLYQALEATAEGTLGMSCEEIFALLATFIEQEG